MLIQKSFDWIAGSDDLGEINRIYNMASFIAMLFCLMAAIECAFASLSTILIANNFFYSLILGILYYVSRFRRKFGISRFLSIFVLLFIYLPLLWIYNGGSASGIPYYIPIFSSFLTILVVGKSDGVNKKALSVLVLFAYTAIVSILLLFEFFNPKIFYHYDNESVRYVDIIISMLFALTSNYLIFRAFIELYYKQLDKVKDYSQQLEYLVVRDSLTHLFNHAHILEKLSETIRISERYQCTFSLIMLDFDYFKQVNDTYGHMTGDQVLLAFAEIIQKNCRSVDIAGRYGGEEFLIILPETHANDALIVANRLSALLKQNKFKQNLMVSVSGGITQYQSGDSATSMLGRADQLLYQAKKNGRDCFKVG